MIKKQYKRMFEIIQKIYNSGETISKRSLQIRLRNYFLDRQFEEIYQKDCNCSGTWSFFDFSDRFQRFANELVRCSYLIKIDKGIWEIV